MNGTRSERRSREAECIRYHPPVPNPRVVRNTALLVEQSKYKAVCSFVGWRLRGEIAKAPRVPPVRVEKYEPRILSITDQNAVLACIPDEDRGIFLAMAHLGLRPGEARALTLADYRDGWLFVDKAAKSKASGAEIHGTKTGKPKRLPVSEELAAWIE